MATTMTLLQLRTAVRQRADIENSTGVYTNSFIKDAELTSYINQSYFELYDLLIQSYGEDYFVSAPYSITTDGVSEFYALPSDFYKLIGISIKIYGSTATYIPMRQGSVNEMMRLSGINNQSVIGLNQLIYRLKGNELWIAPIAQAGQQLRSFYVPRLTTLSADSDTADGISGWTEYIIVDAAIKCMQKEESDVTVLAAQKDALMKRIEQASSNRDAASASRVSDVTNDFEGYEFGFRSGY